MDHPGFFDRVPPMTIAALAALTGATVGSDDGRTERLVVDVRALSDAGPDHVTFLDNRKYLSQLTETRAAACFIAPGFTARLPASTVALVTKAPYVAFARSLHVFYPEAVRSKAARAGAPLIDPTAEMEDGVEIEPGAVVGPEARIGRGTRIAAGAVVGYRVAIGRGCYIGPCASVVHALIGDRVILHPGVRIGQDGFGFAMGPGGHLKVPQVGRVIIQDDVEIGANSAVDRGALKDTIIGEGTKIDNLVQIGHNVVVGRHCVIVGHVGLSGSCELGDFVVVGGKAGIVGHVKIGSGAQVAGDSNVTGDVPAGARVGGTPAVPFKEYARQLAVTKRLGRRRDFGGLSGGDDGVS